MAAGHGQGHRHRTGPQDMEQGHRTWDKAMGHRTEDMPWADVGAPGPGGLWPMGHDVLCFMTLCCVLCPVCCVLWPCLMFCGPVPCPWVSGQSTTHNAQRSLTLDSEHEAQRTTDMLARPTLAHKPSLPLPLSLTTMGENACMHMHELRGRPCLHKLARPRQYIARGRAMSHQFLHNYSTCCGRAPRWRAGVEMDRGHSFIHSTRIVHLVSCLMNCGCTTVWRDMKIASKTHMHLKSLLIQIALSQHHRANVCARSLVQRGCRCDQQKCYCTGLLHGLFAAAGANPYHDNSKSWRPNCLH